MNEYQELRCDCGAMCKRVPAAKKFPKQPGSGMRDIWFCAACNAYAELERETGKPLTGLGTPAVHQKRVRVESSRQKKGLSSDELRRAMRLKPWNFRVEFFTEAQCEEALKIIQQYKPPSEAALEEELLS